MDLKKILINVGILGLFVFGIMSFIITTQTDNSVTNPITNDSLINSTYGDLYTTLNDTQSKAQESAYNFGNITPTQEYGELEVTSIISPTRTAQKIVVGMWNIYIQLPLKILGVSPVVANLIGAILLIFIIIGVWAIWKGVIP